VQFTYEILKVNDSSIKEWSKEDVNRIASKLLENRLVHYTKHNTIPAGNTIKYCYDVEYIHSIDIRERHRMRMLRHQI